MRRLQVNAGDILLTWIDEIRRWKKKKKSNRQGEASLRMNKPDWNKGARAR